MSERGQLASLDMGSSILHEMGEVLDVGTLTVASDLTVRGWNRWLEVASGRTASEVIGRPLLEIFPELVGTQREAAFRRALAGGTVVLSHRLHRYLLPLPATVGVSGYASMQQSARIIPLLREDMRVDGAVAFIQDVTERVASEEELRDAILEAQAASQAKSDFLASMSHELRTPLSAVVGYADLLTMQVSGPMLEPQQEYVDRIRRCAWHLLDLVEEILTFARTEAGKEPLDLSDVDAREIMRDAVMLLEPQAAKKGLVIEARVGDTSTPLHTDVTKVRQILVNLLGNAIKFTDAGSVTLDVHEDEDYLEFIVRDTGPGIPAEQIEHIFEAFTQLDQSRTRVKGGTGLGLTVSRNLARLLGGDLIVESTPGVGSAFHVRVARSSPPGESASVDEQVSETIDETS